MRCARSESRSAGSHLDPGRVSAPISFARAMAVEPYVRKVSDSLTSITKALTSVESAMAIRSRIRERDPAAHAFTYSARSESGRGVRGCAATALSADVAAALLADTTARLPPPVRADSLAASAPPHAPA